LCFGFLKGIKNTKENLNDVGLDPIITDTKTTKATRSFNQNENKVGLVSNLDHEKKKKNMTHAIK
jgi:hypothetical protein